MVRSGCEGTGWVPAGAEELDGCAGELAPEDAAPDEAAGAPEPGVLLAAAPLRGPAPVPVPEICDAQPAPSAAHAASETAGRIRRARKLTYPTYGFALTRVTFIVLPFGVSYATVSPSRAPVRALPSGDAAE